MAEDPVELWRADGEDVYYDNMLNDFRLLRLPDGRIAIEAQQEYCVALTDESRLALIKALQEAS